MNFINSPINALGLDISDLSIKAAQVEKKRGKINIKSLTCCSLPQGLINEGIIQDFDKVAGAIRKLLNPRINRFNAKYAVLSLPETKTFIKVVEIANKKNHVREIISKELPKHVPVDLDEMRIDWQDGWLLNLKI